MVVELLCNALVLHQKVLPERSTGELHLQLAFADKNLTGISADSPAHHLWPGLHNAILKQRRLQTVLTKEGQQGITQRLGFIIHGSLFRTHQGASLHFLHFSTFNIEYPVNLSFVRASLLVVVQRSKDSIQMVAVGVRNEYLSEAGATHKFHNLLHPISI